ncbi:hypothetical protein [Caldicellulosiruptor owensensis]|uniref:hypothetical protein n=1 Tax=Caldicellulosiruptor owensensis TaxID=55205 RepID=UPI001576A632|nr:hypothetical protein [Caldicellulosiruptor owensensis]
MLEINTRITIKKRFKKKLFVNKKQKTKITKKLAISASENSKNIALLITSGKNSNTVIPFT